MPASVPSAVCAFLSWTHRLESPRATVTSGWKSDTGVQVRVQTQEPKEERSFLILSDEPAERVLLLSTHA